MKLEILKETETPLLGRKRVNIQVTFQNVTPSRKELCKHVAALLKTNENLVIIKHIYSIFGKRVAKVICHAYQDEKTLKALEEQHMVERHTGKQEKKPEATAEEKPAAAKPKEEAKME